MRSTSSSSSTHEKGLQTLVPEARFHADLFATRCCYCGGAVAGLAGAGVRGAAVFGVVPAALTG
jgi:hypothetical protein